MAGTLFLEYPYRRGISSDFFYCSGVTARADRRRKGKVAYPLFEGLNVVIE